MSSPFSAISRGPKDCFCKYAEGFDRALLSVESENARTTSWLCRISEWHWIRRILSCRWRALFAELRASSNNVYMPFWASWCRDGLVDKVQCKRLINGSVYSSDILKVNGQVPKWSNVEQVISALCANI